MMLEENAQELALTAKETGTDVLEAIRLAGQATNRVAARNEGGSMSKILILLALALLTSCMALPQDLVRKRCSIKDAETGQPVQATVFAGAGRICERCFKFRVQALPGVKITVKADGYKTWSAVLEPDMKCPKLEKEEDDSSLLPGSLAVVLHCCPFRPG